MLHTTTIPRRIQPMLATMAEPFDDPACLFETKWDGCRGVVAKVDGRLRITGRDAQDYTPRYPELGVLLDLPDGTVLDGELVLLRNGRPDFHALMARHRRTPRLAPCFVEPVHYVAFDLLYLAGQSLMARPLSERRAALAEVMPEHGYVSRCQGVVGKGTRFFAKMLAAGHEGVVAKWLTSTYTPNRRSDAWQKIKERLELPCVVIGYKVVRQELRALLMATLVNGKLAYVGAVELGIEGVRLADLDRLARRLPAVPCSIKAKWLEPRLMCVVRFAGWRPSGAWRDRRMGGLAD